MAQLDACPTGDQEVVGSTPAGLATFFHGDMIINTFKVILSLLRGLSLPSKNVLR